MHKKVRQSSLLLLLVIVLGLVLAACGDNTPTVATTSTTAASSATTAAVSATTAAGAAATTAAGAATTAAATTAAGTTATTAAAAAGSLDRIVIAQGVDPSTLDPQNHNETPANNILNNIYETLVQFDNSQKLQPRLATEWKQIDEKNLEIKLRPGIKWQDGSDFTAEDVKFSLERIADVKKERAKPLLRQPNLNFLDSVTVVDPLTARITTKTPAPLLLPRLATEWIVSKKYVTEKGDDFVGLNPMGTGAYKFVEWKKGSNIDLDAFTGWWSNPGGPAVKKVRFRPIADPQVRINALQAGEVDVIVNVPPEQAKQLETAKTGITTAPSARVIFIILNTLDDSPTPALKNVKVRQALNHAIDRDAIINNILLGNGFKIASPITKLFFAFEELPQYTYDVNKAKALMAEAGFANGFDLELKVPNGRYLKDKEIGEAIAEFWGKVGVRVKFAAEPWSVYQPNIDNRKQPPAFLLGWGNNTWDPDGTLYPQFVAGERYSYYNNPAYDALVKEGRAIVDIKKREDGYKQANKILNQDAPWIFLHQQQDIYGVSKRIQWKARSDESLNAFEITPTAR